jgi:hypothetical protein
MSKLNLSLIERFILGLVLLVLIPGFYLFYTAEPRFEQYVQEDGLVEWMTVLGLLLGSFVCYFRFVKLIRKKSIWFLFVTFCLGLFLFFAAGEEISWGQRIFGIETPEYFKANNAQQETNLHNLVVGGVKVNKLVFSVILVSLLSIFLIVVPFLYQKNTAIKKFLDTSAVPVAQWYQVIGFVVLFALTSMIQNGKNAELLECGGALLFFLIVRYPRNLEIFK